MYIFIVYSLVCFISLIYILFRTIANNKAIKRIWIIINGAFLTNSAIGIVKLICFREHSTIYSHSSLFIWGWWDATFIILISISILLLLIVMLRNIWNKEKKVDENETKKSGVELAFFSAIILLNIIFFILSQFVTYTNSNLELSSDINQIAFYNPQDYDVEMVKEILLDIEDKTKNPNIADIIDRIVYSKNVRLVDYSEAQFPDGNVWFGFLERKLERFNLGENVYYYAQYGRSGEFKVIELEYSIVDGREVKDYYTIILYGKTTLNELVVNIIGAIDEDALNIDFNRFLWSSRSYELWYEVLQENYE